MQRTVRTRNLVAYGIGDIYGGGSFLIISTLLLFFLTEVAGLSPVQAGIVVGAGKFWDAVSDPLMGYISDHVRTRFGRRRVFFLLGIAPVAISFALLWLPVHPAAASYRPRWCFWPWDWPWRPASGLRPPPTRC
jgi:oligogalacturonide transporter